jgi:hypothetical protein
MAGWATVAIIYSNLPVCMRPWIAGIFGIGSLVALVGMYRDRRARLGFLAAFAVVLVWFLLIPPSNSRDWQPDVAVLPWAEIQVSTFQPERLGINISIPLTHCRCSRFSAQL